MGNIKSFYYANDNKETHYLFSIAYKDGGFDYFLINVNRKTLGYNIKKINDIQTFLAVKKYPIKEFIMDTSDKKVLGQELEQRLNNYINGIPVQNSISLEYDGYLVSDKNLEEKLKREDSAKYISEWSNSVLLPSKHQNEIIMINKNYKINYSHDIKKIALQPKNMYTKWSLESNKHLKSIKLTPHVIGKTKKEVDYIDDLILNKPVKKR